MSTGPSSASTRGTRSLRPPSGSERSTGTTKQVPPMASTRARVSSSPETVRAVMATAAPSAARRTAMAVPVPPWLAPVTRATWPSHVRADITNPLAVSRTALYHHPVTDHDRIAIHEAIHRWWFHYDEGHV